MVFVTSLGPWSLRSLLHTPRHPKWPPAATSSHPTHTSQHNNSHLHPVVVCYTETGKSYGAEIPTHPSRAKNIEIRHVCQGKCQHTSLWRNAWLHDSWFGVLNGNICQDAESHVAQWKLKLYNNLWQKSSGSVWKGALAVEKVRQHKDEDSLQRFCHSCGDHAHLSSCCMLHIAMTKLVDTMVWCHPATLFFWNVPGPSQSNNTHSKPHLGQQMKKGSSLGCEFAVLQCSTKLTKVTQNSQFFEATCTKLLKARAVSKVRQKAQLLPALGIKAENTGANRRIFFAHNACVCSLCLS